MPNFGWLDQWPKGQALTCNFDAVRSQMLGCSDGLAAAVGKPGLIAGAPATWLELGGQNPVAGGQHFEDQNSKI